MTTIYKFRTYEHIEPHYKCNQPGDNSGEYVSLKEHERNLNDLAYQIHKLREALTQIYQGFENPVEIARKALNE